MRKYDQHDGAFTIKGVERKTLKKSIHLDYQLHLISQELTQKPRPVTFQKAQTICRCPACKRKQPWARFRTMLLLLVLLYLGLSSGAMIAALARRDFTWQVRMTFQQLLPWVMGLMALIELGALIHYCVMIAWTKRLLKSDTPPLFAETADALREKVAQYSAYAHALPEAEAPHSM